MHQNSPSRATGGARQERRALRMATARHGDLHVPSGRAGPAGWAPAPSESWSSHRDCGRSDWESLLRGPSESHLPVLNVRVELRRRLPAAAIWMRSRPTAEFPGRTRSFLRCHRSSCFNLRSMARPGTRILSARVREILWPESSDIENYLLYL